MVTYSVSVAQRTPALSGSPTLTEIGPVHASGLSWGAELNREGEATASAVIDTLDADVKGAVQEQLDDDSDVTGLELWINHSDDDGNNELVHQGPIVGYQFQGTGDTISFVSRGLLYYLRHMIVDPVFSAATAEFTNVDQYTIATTLIDDWQSGTSGNFGIDTSGVGLSGTTRDRVYQYGDNVFQRVTELAEVDGGFDMSIDADRNLVLVAEKGSDRSGSVVLDRRGLTDAGLAISLAEGDIASTAFVSNTDQDNPLTAVQNDTTLRDSFGRTGVFASFDGITSQTTLQGKAKVLRDSRNRPLISPTPQLLPVVGAGPLDFDVGDTVAFSPSIGIELNLARRVLRKNVSVGDDGNESINVELA